MKQICIFLILGSIGVLSVSSVYAQIQTTPSLVLDTPMERVAPGSEVGIFVRIESDVPINAFDLDIVYPSEVLEFVRASNVDSVVDIWQREPSRVGLNTIHMSGGMFHAFEGEAAILTLLHFRVFENVQKEGLFKATIQNAKMFIADGEGTSVVPQIYPVQFLVAQDAGRYILVYNPDPSAPIMNAYIEQTLDDQNMLIFTSHDSQSGVEKTEVRSYKWLGWGPWVIARSPFMLEGNEWLIQIRSYNNSGSFTEKTVFRWEVWLVVFFALLLTGGIVVGLIYFSYNKKRTSK